MKKPNTDYEKGKIDGKAMREQHYPDNAEYARGYAEEYAKSYAKAERDYYERDSLGPSEAHSDWMHC